VIAAAHRALDERGYGLSSVRFICGTQDLHKTLEKKIAEFLKLDDAILYAACFDANGGVFEPLLGEEDAIISDALNHASIIDGVRLVQGAALALREQRHEGPRALPERGGGQGLPAEADRHRRRLQHGRHGSRI
jgi:glycine C-acetyltransferase